MDISKLPRMSQTPAPPPQDPNEPSPAPPVGNPGFPVVVPPPQAAQAPSVWCRQCNAPNSPTSAYCSGCGAQLRTTFTPDSVSPGVGAEVWVSAIVGVVLMLIGLNFAKWALTTMFGGTYQTNATWQTDDRFGQPVAYWDLQGSVALQDCALFLFGFAMMLEAIVLLVVHSRIKSKVPLLYVALTITIVATVLNLVVCAKLFAAGVLPLLSLLAIAFGGYIAAYEWRLLKYFQAAPRAA